MDGAAAVGHLLRRAGFGLSPSDLDQYRSLGYREAVRKLLDEIDDPVPTDPEGFDPYEPGAIQQLWLERMNSGRGMLAEKLALFWHGHFATSNAKVQDAKLMWTQYKLFRERGAGRFRTLVEGVSRDVAMIRFLDGNSNRRGIANENYGRELQELFTLGIGNYTETGHPRNRARIHRAGAAGTTISSTRPSPSTTAATKTVHGQTGDLGTATTSSRIITGAARLPPFRRRQPPPVLLAPRSPPMRRDRGTRGGCSRRRTATSARHLVRPVPLARVPVAESHYRSAR